MRRRAFIAGLGGAAARPMMAPSHWLMGWMASLRHLRAPRPDVPLENARDNST